MAQDRSWPARPAPAVRAQSPFGRVASPDEIAAAVAWLATDGSGVDQRHRAGCQRRVLPALISDRPRQRSISLASMAQQLPVGSGAATRPGWAYPDYPPVRRDRGGDAGRGRLSYRAGTVRRGARQRAQDRSDHGLPAPEPAGRHGTRRHGAPRRRRGPVPAVRTGALDGAAEHHHHIVCRVCGRSVEVSGPEVEAWAERSPPPPATPTSRHTVEIFGLCPDHSPAPARRRPAGAAGDRPTSSGRKIDRAVAAAMMVKLAGSGARRSRS